MKKNLFLIYLTSFLCLQINNIHSAAMEMEKTINLSQQLIEACRYAFGKYAIEKVQKLLLNDGINVNAKTNAADGGKTALMCAASCDNIDIVKMLLNYKQEDTKQRVEINAVDVNGTTAFMYATLHGNVEVVRTLLDHKPEDPTQRVDIHAKSNNGNTAFMLAVLGGHVEVVRTLLDYEPEDAAQRVDVNATNAHGETAFMLARASLDSDQLIRMLLNHKRDDCKQRVDIHAVDIDGRTAFMHAAMDGDLRKVRTLLDYNPEDTTRRINFKLTDNAGLNALMHAIKSRHEAIENRHDKKAQYLYHIIKEILEAAIESPDRIDINAGSKRK